MISIDRRQQADDICCWLFLFLLVFASSAPRATADEVRSNANSHKIEAANHRMDIGVQEGSENASLDALPIKMSTRQSRQYDPAMSATSTGSYAAVAADGGAYVTGGQSPTSSGGYAGTSSNGVGSNYANEMSGAYLSSVYHDPLSINQGYPAPRGYPTQPTGPLYGNSMLNYPAPHNYNPISSMFAPSPAGGLLSSSMLPLMGGKGFEVSEIICTAIAVAVGAVIVGAPFILLYLFFMNQMNGSGGPGGMGPSGGAISLTGPTSSTTVNGRKKRNTSLPEALFKQLSPLVNNEQVASTFKALMNSIAKYQV